MEGRIYRHKSEKIRHPTHALREHDDDVSPEHVRGLFMDALPIMDWYVDVRSEYYYDSSGDEDLYAEYRHAENEIYEREQEITDTLVELLIQEHYADVIEITLECIHAVVKIPTHDLSAQSPATALMLAEASNLLAKEVSPLFYILKPPAIVAAWKLGCHFGRADDGAYYLGDPVSGVASFHDPRGEIANIIQHGLGETIPHWPYEWSGVRRQDDALNMLESRAEDDGGLVDWMAESTLHPDERSARKHINADQLKIKIGDIFNHQQKGRVQ